MDLGSLTNIISKGMADLPKPVRVTLEQVDVVICQDIAHATAELQHDFEEFEPLPADCKGVFVGDPLETEEDDEGETQTLPTGVILIIAANISDEKEAALVLMHEIGHALDMSEDEVSALGLGVAQDAAPAGSTEQPTS